MWRKAEPQIVLSISVQDLTSGYTIYRTTYSTGLNIIAIFVEFSYYACYIQQVDLNRLNHWWNGWDLKADAHLQAAKNSGLNYIPTPFSFSDLAEARIYTLRGPRQIGKTTTLKFLIQSLIEKHQYDPKSILWTTADTLRRVDLLERHLIELVEIYKSFKQKPRPYPPLIVIDEVTSIVNWQRAIKALWDQGLLRPFCIILTGSSAQDLKKGSEKMAGRRGVGTHLDRVLLPMSYGDFLKEIPEADISAYQQVGGYPFRVTEYKRDTKNFKPFFGLNILEEALLSEISRRGLDRDIQFEVIARLSSVGTTAISYDAFSKPTTTSKDTVKLHLTALGDAFMLATYSAFDLAKKRKAPKKDRKFLWLDPVFRYLAAYLELGPILDEALVSEVLVGAHLIRCYEDRSFEGLASLNRVFTWKGDRNREVDFVMFDRKQQKAFPIEVKYQSSISEWDWMTMEKIFGCGTLVTRLSNAKKLKTRIYDLPNFLKCSNPLALE